jgi:hypothetical protein
MWVYCSPQAGRQEKTVGMGNMLQADTSELCLSLSSSHYTYTGLLQSGALEKLSMVRNVIVHKRSDEIVGMVISRLHVQDQSSPYSLARLLEVVR